MLEQTKYCIEETIKNSTFLLYYYTAKFCIFFAVALHMCCSILYTKQYKRLIFKRKAHQLLIAGNKIVTKKRRKSLCGRLHAQR